jgi:hypothetical protein
MKPNRQKNKIECPRVFLKLKKSSIFLFTLFVGEKRLNNNLKGKKNNFVPETV